MSDQEPPRDFDEPFYGFEMTDEQIPECPFRPVALELKHTFEHMRTQASTTGQAMFLPLHLQDAISEFLWRPSMPTLAHLLEVSPALHDSIVEITRRVAPNLVRQLPDLT